MRWRVLPFLYPNLTRAQCWVLTVFLTGAVLSSVVLHEYIHLAQARKFGKAPKEVSLYFFGSAVEAGAELGDRWKCIQVNLSGVVFTIGLALGLFLLALLCETNARPLTSHVLLLTGVANILLALFQLLPALPLDGGKIILDFFHNNSRVYFRAVRALYYLGNVISVGFMGAGIYVAASETLLAGGYFMGAGMPVLGSWLFLIGLTLAAANFSEFQSLSASPQLPEEEVKRAA